MNYKLSNISDSGEKISTWQSLKKLLPLLSGERRNMIIALVAILINSGLTIIAPLLVGHAVDTHLMKGDYNGILLYAGLLLLSFLGVFASGVVQTRMMGTVGQHILFKLRAMLFEHIQELPLAFFSQNKAGDLISRINNDTDKLNQFLSRSLMQFVSNFFVIVGAGIAMLVVNPTLGGASLLPAVGLFIFVQLTSAWVKRRNVASLQTLGGLSSEVQQSLENFRVIAAFNRRDYFRDKFATSNNTNYQAAVRAGIANIVYVPVFGLVSNLGTLIVVAFGLQLISQGDFTFGLLISYLAYVTRFYDPLRQMATIWSDLQGALAGWERISEILNLQSDMPIVAGKKSTGANQLEFKDVSFHYPNGPDVLKHITFSITKGKTYALVGPTGGGKSTTASLMARLYDPTEGTIYLDGRDIKSYAHEARVGKIGFILQDPFLFSGSIKDNILYGNARFANASDAELVKLLKKEGLGKLLERFPEGLNTKVDTASADISLGQKQLIAFMRAILRRPEILILDEATANIDTVTEQLLDDVIQQLPGHTTVIIIAHRLNTIANADQILFVNAGTITPAGSLQDAVAMLEKDVRTS